MNDRVALTVEIQGLRIEYRGGSSLFEDVVRRLVDALARGARPVLAPVPAAGILAAGFPAVGFPAVGFPAAGFPGAGFPATVEEGPAPRGTVAAAPSALDRAPPHQVPMDRALPDRALLPAPAPAPQASPRPVPAGGGPGPGFDPAPLYAALAKEGGRRAERDAVLLALVALAASGKRDATPAEITAHLAAAGFPARDLKAKPILAKLSHRKGLAAPGLLPGTFRATPAGFAFVLRHARGS